MKITGATIEASGVTMALEKIRLKQAFMTEALPQLLNEKADGLSEVRNREFISLCWISRKGCS